MLRKRINNISVIFIILCSTSFYHFSMLGQMQILAELAGIGVMVLLIIFDLVYSRDKIIKRNFTWPVSLILISVITSMFTAYLIRDQSFGQTIFAQRALYFYLFYFLLHRLKIEPKDLEKMFIGFSILYVLFYFIQSAAYPRIIFDAYVREDRGTIRIYMAGSCYLTVAFFISVQNFLRAYRFKFLVLFLILFSVVILNAGRQTIAIMTLVVVFFVIFDKKVKSRLFLIVLGLIGAFALFLIFQDIFETLIALSKSEVRLGEDNIRIRAASFYLTDFFKHPIAYITGNGAFSNTSNYGKEIQQHMLFYQFFLGDIGLIGNYVIYGAFFVIGVLTICLRSLRMKIEAEYIYIKYMFIAVILALLTSAAFEHTDYIVMFGCVLYMLDVSKNNLELDKVPLKKTIRDRKNSNQRITKSLVSS